MKGRRTAVVLGIVLAVPLSIALVLNTFFGPQTHAAQARERFEAAKNAEQGGDRNMALERLRHALRLSPWDLEIHRYYQNLKPGGVVEEYRKLLDDHPEDAAAHYLHGRLLEGEDRERAFRKGIELDGESAWAHAGLGRHLFFEEKFKESLPHLKQAYAKLHQQGLGSLIAEAHMRLQDWGAALQAWRDLQFKFPRSGDGWYGEAALCRMDGRHADARKLLEEALKRDPENPRYLSLKAEIHKPR